MTMAANRLLLAALLLASPMLAGCTEQPGLPRLTMSVDDPEVRWGNAFQAVIRNTGDGKAQAPVQLQAISANGTVVRTIEDITGGRGIPVGGQTVIPWNGTNDEGRPVLWGTYTLLLPQSQARVDVELLPPPTYAMTVDPIPREAPAGDRMTFQVNNTGTEWINGTLTLAAGRSETILYTSEVEVQLAPDQGYTFHWDGKDPDGEDPEAQKYLVAARVEPSEQGPTPFAQDVFELT